MRLDAGPADSTRRRSVTLDSARCRRSRTADVRSPTLVTGRPGAYLLSGAQSIAPRRVDDVAHRGRRRPGARCRVADCDGSCAPPQTRGRSCEPPSRDGHRERSWHRWPAPTACNGTGIARRRPQFANVTYNVMRGGVVSGYRDVRGRLLGLSSHRNASWPRRQRCVSVPAGARSIARAPRADSRRATMPSSCASACEYSAPDASPAATVIPAGPGTTSRSGCVTRRRPDHPLRGQLARHLPELGGAVSELPRVPARARLGVRQRLDCRRVQSLPDHPGRHRLGGARSRRPVEPHRLLG